MFNRFKKHVNFVIKDQALRYMVVTQPTIAGITEYGEVGLEPGLIEDGKIIDSEGFQTILKNLVTKKKWKRKSLLFCVPDSSVAIREQLVPKELEKEEIKSYINMELNNGIRLPFANPVLDFVVLGEENDKTKILLFAYPNDRIKSYKNSFEKAGLKPVVADLTSLSLYRFYESQKQTSGSDHILSVQWNMDAMILTAFHDRKPLFTRYVKSSLESEKWTWNTDKSDQLWSGSELEVNQAIEEQIITIDRFIDFYQYSVMKGEKEITKVLLTGDFPYMERAEDLIRERYNLQIDTLKNTEEQFGFPSKYAELLGLSIKRQR